MKKERGGERGREGERGERGGERERGGMVGRIVERKKGKGGRDGEEKKKKKKSNQNLHSLKLRPHFVTTQLKLLNNITNLFKSMSIMMTPRRSVRNDQKSGNFEQNHLVGFTNFTKFL